MGKMTIKKCFKRSQDTKVADYKHKKESFIWPHYERRENGTCSDNWSDLWKEDRGGQQDKILCLQRMETSILATVGCYVCPSYREWTHFVS